MLRNGYYLVRSDFVSECLSPVTNFFSASLAARLCIQAPPHRKRYRFKKYIVLNSFHDGFFSGSLHALPPKRGEGFFHPFTNQPQQSFANGAYEPGTRHCQAAEILSLGSFQRLDQNRIPDSPVFAKVAPFVARGVVVFCLD